MSHFGHFDSCTGNNNFPFVSSERTVMLVWRKRSSCPAVLWVKMSQRIQSLPVVASLSKVRVGVLMNTFLKT